MSKSIVVIGAGPAGLSFGLELLRAQPNWQVTILEASTSIGGISQTIRYGENRMDIGGHRFFSKDENVVAWWKSILPIQGAPALDDMILGHNKEFAPDGPDPEQIDRVMLIRDRVSRIYYDGHFFDYPISLSWNTIRSMGFRTTIKAGVSYLHALLHKLPETSLENFYINRFGRVLYTMFFEGYTEKLWGRHPRDISADWGAQRVKGLSIKKILQGIIRKIFHLQGEVETSLIEQFYYPKYGPGQLWETVADTFRSLGGRILLDSTVTGIEIHENQVSAVAFRSAGETHRMEADILVSSMPIQDLMAGISGIDIPDDVQKAAATLPYRDFVTIGLLLSRLALTNTTNKKTLGDIIPDCWIYVQDTSVKLGRIQIFNNWSPYMTKDPAHQVWVGLEYFCKEGDPFWEMSDEAAVQFATDELIRLGIIHDGCVLDSHRKRVQKAYPAYFDGYADIDSIISFLDGFENLYCIGRNGQHRYNNMDHSMATAFAAVENIVSGEKNKDNIWSVNTEKEYHEEKAARR